LVQLQLQGYVAITARRGLGVRDGTDKKEKKIFLIYKEIQKGEVEKS
jgi:hypothetical protein